MNQLLCALSLCLFSWAIPSQADAFTPGDNLYARKEFSQARQTFLSLARDSKDSSVSAAARLRAAACLYEMKNYEAFAAEAKATLAQNQGRHLEKMVLTKHRLAQLPYIQGDWAQAAESLGRFVTENPRCQYTFDALNNQAKALGKLGRLQQARQCYQDYLKEYKKSPFVEKARFKAALCLYDLGEYDSFIKEGKETLKRYPANGSPDAEWLRLHLAQMPGRRRRWSESAAQLESIIATNPQVTLEHAKIGCGRAYLMAADQMRNDMNQCEAFRAKGLAYLQETRVELEQKLAQGKRTPTNADVREMILESYYYARDYQGLANAARKLAEERQPASTLWAQGMLWLGIARYSMSPPDLKGAGEALDKILEAGVKDTEIKNHLPSRAALWRVGVAQQMKDAPTIKALQEKIAKLPEGPLKKAARAQLQGPTRGGVLAE